MPGSVESNKIRALVLGDVVGKSGCRALFSMVKSLKKELNADIVIVNGENAAEGSGITPEIVADFFNAGVDVITTGNHVWRNKNIYPLLEKEERIIRPENYPKNVPGRGTCTFKFRDTPISVLNLEGSLNKSRLRCPFLTGKESVQRLQHESPIIFVDFHAESAQEKEALAVYLDGEVSVVFGTHTHVQTADERVLPKGTGYITDIGMTGPIGSVIGMSSRIAIDRALTQMPLKLEVEDKPAVVMGAIIELDVKTGNTLSLTRIKKLSNY
jgi:metallophosphoesterase (TIGR00282 family)